MAQNIYIWGLEKFLDWSLTDQTLTILNPFKFDVMCLTPLPVHYRCCYFGNVANQFWQPMRWWCWHFYQKEALAFVTFFLFKLQHLEKEGLLKNVWISTMMPTYLNKHRGGTCSTTKILNLFKYLFLKLCSIPPMHKAFNIKSIIIL